MDIKEFYELFKSNGININIEDLKELFNIIDDSGNGSLDVEEFK
jgi:Ca2+-binding EF-hand superfamily protein